MTASHRAGTDCRVEEDALGTIEVPTDHLWGAQTQRSHLNFPIGVERYRWGRPVIRALGILKKCAALANGELGQLPREKEMTHSIAPSSLLTS
jgi:fumarate hydratase, class II